MSRTRTRRRWLKSENFTYSLLHPEFRELREAVASRTWRRLPRLKTLRKNAVAGLTIAIAEIPDGMANALLAGVNPIFGLYANIVGPFVGGLLSSTQLMTIVTTSAATLTVGQSIALLPESERASVLFVTVILCGVFQILLGLAGAAKLVRFVSYSVMTGLLSGIGVLLVLSQLPNVTGVSVKDPNKIVQTFHLLANIERLQLTSLVLSLLTIGLAVLLPRTKIGSFGTLIAVVVPSVLATYLQWDEVRLVGDYGDIPSGFPMPHWPQFASFLKVVMAALALATVILVQGAGVSQGARNPDRSRIRPSRDFLAQGSANIASGLFRGLPVGGSVSATTLTVVAGATSRWAPILAGLWVLVIVMAFSDLVDKIAMPALSGLLILVGVRSVIRSEYRSIWNAGLDSRLAGAVTFVSTLMAPIEMAVGLGVVLSGILFITKSATGVSVAELIKHTDGRIEERDPPKELRSRDVTVIEVYGSLFFAGARTLEGLLPSPDGSQCPAVILRIRNHTSLGATIIDVLTKYAEKLKEVDGRLYISGVGPKLLKQLRTSGKLQADGPVTVFEKTPFLGESTFTAHDEAKIWLVSLPRSTE